MTKKAIIIGSGVGGLSTALRLLATGYEVTVYEKENTIGGKVNIIGNDEFKFDSTASILMSPQMFIKAFTDANLNYKDYFSINYLDTLHNVNFEDNTNFKVYSNLNKLSSSLECLSKSTSTQYLDFITDTYKKYILTEDHFFSKAFDSINDFLNIDSIYNIIKLNPFTNCYEYICNHIDNEYVRNYLAFQSHYVGISPFNGPNIYSIIPAISQVYGLFYFDGGVYSYIKALQNAIVDLKGIIKTNKEVEEIIIKDNKAIGVKVDDTFDNADIVICNADYPYAINNLIKDDKIKNTKEKVNKMKYTCSTFILYLALNKKYKDLEMHNFYLVGNFKESLEAPFKGILTTNPNLYVYCPSKVDSTICKDNHELLNVVIRVPNLQFDNIEWNSETIKALKSIILNNLSKIKGLEDIKNHIVYETYTTPNDMLTKYNSYYGAAFGLSPTLSQTNYFRPHHRCDEFDNLYFVGASTHPGSGVSIVLKSSELVVNEINKK